MKLKNLILTISVIVIVLAFAGCANKKATSISLNAPDKINMYADGKQKQVAKKGSDYEKTLFDRVTFLVNVRMPQSFSAMKGEISDKDIKDFKGYAVEFIYDKVQTTTIDNKEVKFSEVVFPLGEKLQNTAFIKTTDNFYVGVGIKENLDYLVKTSVK
jgi:hypothetical protein